MTQSANSAIKDYSLLVVDDDNVIRDNLKEYLLYHHTAPYALSVDEAATAEEALDLLKSKQYDLIISDINLPDKDGFYILKQAKEVQPHIKKALITAYDLDTYIHLAKEEQIYNIIIKTAPFNFQEFSTVVNNLLLPDQAFGLERYLDVSASVEKIVIQSSDQIMIAQQALKNFLESFLFPDIDALSVVLVEAITNAVYHASKTEDGEFRYQKGQHIEALDPHEAVIISYGSDTEKVGISIQDPAGSMSADEVIYWLERNISGKSLMDTHGRGIYLIHRLMDRVVINLAKNRCTEIILLHYIETQSGDNKPLYINELN